MTFKLPEYGVRSQYLHSFPVPTSKLVHSFVYLTQCQAILSYSAHPVTLLSYVLLLLIHGTYEESKLMVFEV